MGRSLPTVQDETLVGTATPLVVGSGEWYAWLEGAAGFAFVGATGTLTARKQRPSQRYQASYWYAFRKSRGKLYKVYLGRSADLSGDCLAGAAATLAERAGQAAAATAPAFELTRAASLAAPPPRAGLVARQRLYAQLDAGLTTSLTLLVAPAGYGKTTLLAGWLAALPGDVSRVAWATLDAPEYDLAGLLRMMIAALRMHAPSLGATTLALLQQLVPVHPELLLATLLADLRALDTRCVLVLDDYQHARAPEVHAALGWLIERLPAGFHLYLATRKTPPLPLARLRAAGRLTELRTSDLRFTPGESAQFLNTTMGLALDASEVDTLEMRTEGWVGGLQLAALALRAPADRARLLAGFAGSHHFVAEYFADQVLEGLPPPIAAFVLQTSILGRLYGPLCDAMLSAAALPVPAAGAQTILLELERASLFLMPLDDQRTWFRYHPLFAEMARARLHQVLPDTAVAALHLRASEWWEHYGLAEEAIGHALAAQAFGRAADLIEAQARDHMMSAAQHMERWLAALPPALWQQRPRLWLARAAGLLNAADYAALEPCLLQAEAALASAGADGAAMTRRDIAAIRALLRGAMEDPSAPEMIADVLTDLAVHHPLRPVLAAGLTYATFGRGDLAGARQVATTALALLPPGAQSLADRISLLALLALVAWGQGRLNEVEQRCAEVVELAQSGTQLVPVLGTGVVLLLRGVLLAERNQLAAGGRALAECAEVAGQAQLAPLAITAQMYLALVLQAQGERDAAQERFALAEAALHSGDLPPLTQKELEGCRALFWLRNGDTAAAASWAAGYPASAATLTAYDYPRIAAARTLIAQGHAAQATAALVRLVAEAEQNGLGRFRVWAQAYTALAWQAQNDMPRALAALERALALALPEGYVRLFADEGAPMASLLRAAQAAGTYPRYVAQILAACAPAAPAGGAALAEPLTPREQEVLRLIAAGASNQAIAQQLVLTLGTVKKYANSIFGKIGVRSRTQAIVRGRELGLL